MGINNLLKVKIENTKSSYHGKTVGDLARLKTLDDLAGKRIVVDASHAIYRAFLSIKAQLTDKDGNPTQHIKVISNWLIQFAKSTMLWVFDPVDTTPLKASTVEKRKAKKSAFSINAAVVAQVQHMLRLAGIDYVTAPATMEAEKYAAFLCRPRDDKEAFCDYVLSGDTDVLIYGAPMLYPNTDSNKKKFPYKLLDPAEICYHLDISHDQLIYTAIALGTDFNEKVPKIGPAKVVSRIKANTVKEVFAYQNVIDYFRQDCYGMSAEIVATNPDYDAYAKFLTDLGFSSESAQKLEVARRSA